MRWWQNAYGIKVCWQYQRRHHYIWQWIPTWRNPARIHFNLIVSQNNTPQYIKNAKWKFQSVVSANEKPLKSRIHCFWIGLKSLVLLQNLKSDSVEFTFNNIFAKDFHTLSNANLAGIVNTVWMLSSSLSLSLIRLLCHLKAYDNFLYHTSICIHYNSISLFLHS